MAKEIVAKAATVQQVNLINRGEARLRVGDIIVILAGALLGDFAASWAYQAKALTEGAYASAARFIQAVLLRPGCQPQPYCMEVARLRNEAEYFIMQDNRKVGLQKAKSGILFPDYSGLTKVSFVETPVVYDPTKAYKLTVKDTVECLGTYGVFGQLWAKDSTGKWAQRPEIKASSKVTLTACRQATFTVEEGVTFKPAELATLKKVAAKAFNAK